MKQIIAPQSIAKFKHPAIFLAGSIEMGKAIKWQEQVVRSLSDYDVTLFNPRRDHWDASWHETIHNRKFKEQVSWELAALEKSDYIILYFDPKSKSPISLLELGLFARSHKIFCCCPPKFWRQGNVEFVCKQFKIPFYTDLNKLLERVKKSLSK